jgi:hypothetical protein
MSLSDIDAEIEIGGHLLRIETKYPGSNLLDAQLIRDRKLLQINRLIGWKLFTILNLWGIDSIFEEMQHYTGPNSPIVPCTNEDIVRFCEQWAARANAHPRAR